ncbi:MAG: carbohydrate ABC transporter substrate-binding protein [Streptomyces sp.]|nr:carbohydrate ABC transporter substrate-binding protein [Streptomyces sp.]
MRTSGRTRKAAVIAVAGLAACATLITGCSSSKDTGSGDKNSSAPSNEKITLHVGDFGSFGYDDKKGAALYAEYHKLHPNITIVEDNVSDAQPYWDALKLHLTQGSGLDDIQAIEVGYIGLAIQPNLANKFVDFKSVQGFNAGDWLPYKETQATTGDGKIIGLGTDAGPTAICYNKAAFQAAGLPTDRNTLAQAWNGDWQKFIDLGKQFEASKTKPKGMSFSDSGSGLFNAVLASQKDQYSDASGKLIYDTSAGVQTAWNIATEAVQNHLTAGFQQLDQAGTWNAAFKNNKFATVTCPSWMVGLVQSNSGDAGKGKWDIAQPPQVGNWGGSFLAVPKASKHQQEAIALAQWLTAPAQQVKVFEKFGNIPSTTQALADPAVQNLQNPYFPGTPVGQIFATAAKNITPAPIGQWDGTVKDIITKNGILDMEQRGTSKDKAWSNVVAQIKDKVTQ